MLMARSPSQKDPFIVIDESERPPVVAYGGRSPSKSPAERQTGLNPEFSQSATRPYINVNPTETAAKRSGGFGFGSGTVTPRNRWQKFGEGRWDGRHHVSPSQFNTLNHTFYKVGIES